MRPPSRRVQGGGGARGIQLFKVLRAGFRLGLLRRKGVAKRSTVSASGSKSSIIPEGLKETEVTIEWGERERACRKSRGAATSRETAGSWKIDVPSEPELQNHLIGAVGKKKIG